MTFKEDNFPNGSFVPRTFFLPGITDPKTAEAIYVATSKNLYGETVPERRIQRLDYIHNGIRYRAEVGDQDQGGEGTVIAIFGPSSPRNLYYVTTLSRGVMRGGPIMVGSDEVQKAYHFLPE